MNSTSGGNIALFAIPAGIALLVLAIFTADMGDGPAVAAGAGGTAATATTGGGAVASAGVRATQGDSEAASEAGKTDGVVKVASTVGAEFSDAQKKSIEAIVEGYLLEKPEILERMMQILRERETAEREARNVKLVIENRETLYRSEFDYVFGNPKGDVGIVEYFDYNCGWCKRALNEVQQLAESDPNVRVILKEFPIFGEDSEFAARAAMASKRQGKYWDFHVALMEERRVTKDNTLEIAARVGLDVEKLKQDMQAPEIASAIQQTQKTAQELGIEGTPAFIVDTKVNVGFVPATGLREMIAETRTKGCTAC